jgi:hypothetical protein
MKQKTRTEKVNIQTADPKSQSLCIFFQRTFFKKNYSLPHKWQIWFLPETQVAPLQNQKGHFCQSFDINVLILNF